MTNTYKDAYRMTEREPRHAPYGYIDEVLAVESGPSHLAGVS